MRFGDQPARKNVSERNWREIVEIVGILAIVASLVFVGLQLRQDQRIAAAQIFADFDDTQIELSRLLIENHEVWRAGSSEEELSDAEQFVFRALAEAVVAKYNGFIARAIRLETQPVESYAIRYAFLLHSTPGLRRYFEKRCQLSAELLEVRSGSPTSKWCLITFSNSPMGRIPSPKSL